MSSRRMAVLCLLFVLPTATLVAAENDPSVPESVTFAEHVAPIFFANCVSCHRPNDVAPMSLLTYEAARPWAKSI